MPALPPKETPVDPENTGEPEVSGDAASSGQPASASDPVVADGVAADPGAPLPIVDRPQLWGRLTAVRRTLDWASRDAVKLAAAPFLGAGCARLLTTVLQADDLDPAAVASLQSASDRLVTADALDADERQALVRAVAADLDQIVSITVVGAVQPPLARRSALIIPERRRRGSSARKAAASKAVGAPVTPDADSAESKPTESKPAESKTTLGDPAADVIPADGVAGAVSADAAAGAQAASTRSPTGSEPPDGAPAADAPPRKRRGRSTAASAKPKPEPPPKRLPLGHADHTGAPLSTLGHVAADLVARLAGAGIVTIADVLRMAPARFERHPLASAAQLVGDDAPEGLVSVRGHVLTRCTRFTPGGRRREVVLVDSGDDRVVCRWLTSTPRGWDGWEAGQVLGLVGAVADSDDLPVLYEAEPVGVDGRGSGLMPVYGVEGVSDAELRDVVAAALRSVEGRLADPLPNFIADRHRLLSLADALRDAHFPSNQAQRGRVRLAFEELLLLQLGVAWRSRGDQPERGVAHKILHSAVGHLQAHHGLLLDDGQELVFSEIRRDLLRSQPMARLLQGDVGTGKGRVALLSAVVVAENTAQVAMISPDPMAAERSFLYAEPLLRSVGIVPMLVGSRLNHAQLDAIRRGEVHIVFGTRRMLSEDVVWRRLGLVVVEERGPYGTVTPASFRSRKQRPDLLVVTRAPIPSSLAFTVFGDLDVSVIPMREQLRASGRIYDTAERDQAYARVREKVQEGRQAYVVFPVRDGKDLLGPDDARRMADALAADALSGCRMAIYCSAMSKDERQRVFDDFEHRRVDVLICTTFIEDAPSVANATELVVEYADMYDLTRLHRLRGHVGLGVWPGHCHFVMSDTPVQGGRQMLDHITDELDGFRLAELDLQLRGPEALLGERAGDAPGFAWADPPRDRELLLRARAEAFRLLRGDSGFRRHPALADAVTARWGEWLGAQLPGSQAQPAASRSRRRRRRRRKR